MLNLKLYKSGIISFSESVKRERRKERIIDEFNYITTDGIVKKFDYQYAVKKTNAFKKSLQRTRSAIENIVDNNKFDYFLTVTFNGNYVNRYSAEEAYNAYKNVIKRLKYQFGGMSYVQVPEFHKDRAIHFHIFCKFGKKPKLKYKGKTDKGQNYYTITNDFKKEDCFLTIEKIIGVAPSWYLTKYITKSTDYPLKRKYACSRDIKRTDVDKPLLKFTFEDMPNILLDGELQKPRSFVELYFQNNFPLCRDFDVFGTLVRYHNGACAVVDSSKSNIKDENILTLAEKIITVVARYGEVSRLIDANFDEFNKFRESLNA